MDSGPPGSSVHGILQARILEWVDFPDPGIEPRCPALQGVCLPSEPPGRDANARLRLCYEIFSSQIQ